jgi:hypothetical protein
MHRPRKSACVQAHPGFKSQSLRHFQRGHSSPSHASEDALPGGAMAQSTTTVVLNGAIAQMGERLHGMQEVRGSIPLGSTKHLTQEGVWHGSCFAKATRVQSLSLSERRRHGSRFAEAMRMPNTLHRKVCGAAGARRAMRAPSLPRNIGSKPFQ